MPETKRPVEGLWDKADIIIKGVGVLLVSGAITLYSIRSERRQFEVSERNRRAQIVVETISSRERAAAEMRARMFDTLVQHYFLKKGDDATKVSILEMIGYNFQHDLNLNPLFERLDEELHQKGSPERLRLRQAAQEIVRRELNQIAGSGGALCSLDLAIGEAQVVPCAQPLTLTLRSVREDQVAVSTEVTDQTGFTVTFYTLPLVNNTMLGELKYAVLLSAARPEAGQASVRVVRLPDTYYDTDNRLRVDQMINDLTAQKF